MKILIDTNKYLDFFRASDHSIITLEKLLKLIDDGKFELLLPRQIIDEFIRDKDLIYKAFVEENFRIIKFPGFLSGDKDIKKTNNQIEKIKEKYRKKFYSPRSKINITINKLFKKAIIIENEQDMLFSAYFRTLNGNPPRKNNRSFGDAIVWETLINKFSNDEVVIISGDGDYSSDIKESELNSFLLNEWNNKSKKKISLEQNLGRFLNTFIVNKKEKISKNILDEENNLIVGHLINSEILNQNLVKVSEIANNVFNSYKISSKKCSCCGEDFVSSDLIYGSDKCQKCSIPFSTAKDCARCGKHFHESDFIHSPTSIYLSGINNSLCQNCRGNIGYGINLIN